MRIIESFENLVSAKLGMIKSIITIAVLEARLAELSVIPFLLSSVFLLIVGLTVWSSIMILIGYGFLIASGCFLYSILGVLAINVIFALILLKCLHVNLRRLSFSKTREILTEMERERNEDY